MSQSTRGAPGPYLSTTSQVTRTSIMPMLRRQKGLLCRLFKRFLLKVFRVCSPNELGLVSHHGYFIESTVLNSSI